MALAAKPPAAGSSGGDEQESEDEAFHKLERMGSAKAERWFAAEREAHAPPGNFRTARRGGRGYFLAAASFTILVNFAGSLSKPFLHFLQQSHTSVPSCVTL